jgi:citrate lyase subunit beta/citryl-CoA lyase
MSSRSRELPRRCCLSVPGSSPRFLAKAAGVAVDEVFLDLEDSVAPQEKANARALVVDGLQRLAESDDQPRVRCVRVNGWSSPWTLEDCQAVVLGAGDVLDEVMLPKVASAAEVVALDLVLGQLEAKAGLPVGEIGIEAQIESAAGLAEVEAICSASKRLEAIVLGPADLAASLGMPWLTGGVPSPDYPGDAFYYPLFRLLVAGRRAGVAVVDGPYLRIRDHGGLERSARASAALGVDGKWAVHPDQVPVIQAAFTPSAEQVEAAEALLAAYEEATAQGQGAVALGAEMIDEASRKMAVRVLRRAGRPEAGGAGSA